METKTSVLILHGIGGYAGIHWQKWLKEALEKEGMIVVMPNLPKADHPDRKTWETTVSDIISKLEVEHLIIVGHSLGMVTALDAIEKLKQPIKGLCSVAGPCSDYGAELNSYFLKERHINFGKVRQNVKKTVIFFADNDPYVPQEKLHELANNLKAKPIMVHNGGHLNTEAGFTTFPQLLKEIMKI